MFHGYLPVYQRFRPPSFRYHLSPTEPHRAGEGFQQLRSEVAQDPKAGLIHTEEPRKHGDVMARKVVYECQHKQIMRVNMADIRIYLM